MPTTKEINPIACAKKLAKFVLSNQLDGVDVKYTDDYAIAAGTASLWLTAFTQELRRLLPTHIISHSIKPSYFQSKNQGYSEVNMQVRNKIDFYNILYME
jgi:CO dehydrogenase/acetyl-CoA synthase epsilon subunit